MLKHGFAVFRKNQSQAFSRTKKGQAFFRLLIQITINWQPIFKHKTYMIQILFKV